jgi:hypothetical protein
LYNSDENKKGLKTIMALIDDLQKKIGSLDDFKAITTRILIYIPEVISFTKNDRGYVIIESTSGGTQKFTRPYNSELFINDSIQFETHYVEFERILLSVFAGVHDFTENEHKIINKVTYTMQQSIGIALDLLGNQNANRKHVGNRFEELIGLIVDAIGIKNKKIVLKIPYENDGVYSCETDLVLTPYDQVRSDNSTIDENEVVVSLKTSSKDRMGKIFIDKILMSKFVGRDVKVIGIFLNDIQRKGQEKVGYTFVAGLFMVYTNFLTKLDGVFFVDPPPHANKEPYKVHIKRFSEFILVDVKELLNSTS